MAFLNSSLNAPKRYQSLTISAYLFMHSKTSLPLPSQSAEPNISPRKPFLFRPFLAADGQPVVAELERMIELALQPEALLKLWVSWVLSMPASLIMSSALGALVTDGFKYLSTLACENGSFWSICTSAVSHCHSPLVACFACMYMLRASDELGAGSIAPLASIADACQQLSFSFALGTLACLLSKQAPQVDRDVEVYRDLKSVLFTVTDSLLRVGFQPDSVAQPGIQPAFQLEQIRTISSSVPKEHLIGYLQWMLPLSMNFDNLCATACLISISRWKMQVDDLSSLSLGIDFMIAIQDTGIRAFVASCVWAEYLCEFLAGVVGLLEKVGKAPKERVCLKALNLKPSGVRAFTLLMIKFLKSLSVTCIHSGPVMLPHEPCWNYAANPLCTQREPNSGAFLNGSIVHLSPLHVPLVAAHVQLCQVVDLVMAHEVRSVRPLSLFSLPVRAAFFSRLAAEVGSREIGSVSQDIEALDPNQVDQDAAVAQARLAFIMRVIPFIVQEASTGTPNKLQLSKVISLAEQLRVNMDLVRAQLAFSMLQCNLNDEAEESIQLIGDAALVSSCLFEAARSKVALIFKKHDADPAFLAHVSQDMDDWLLTPSSDVFQHAEVTQTPELLGASRLIKKVHAMLPVDSPLHAKCAQLSHVLNVIDQHFTEN